LGKHLGDIATLNFADSGTFGELSYLREPSCSLRLRDGLPLVSHQPTGPHPYTNVQGAHPPVHQSRTIVQWWRAREPS
jgi:hypothetical protein